MAPPKAPARPKTVTEYIAAAPKEARPKLRALRKLLRTVAPGATESLKWGMPSYSYRRILFNFAAFKHHVSLFPGPAGVRAFKKELAPFTISTATIQFPFARPLPLSLIRRIASHRVKESLEKDGRWRTKK